MHRYRVLATDYDGTLTDDGTVAPAVLAGLLRLKAHGRLLVLVTGREMEDLGRVFPELDVFDRIVAENGGVIYRPDTDSLQALAPPPAPAFVDLLRRRGVRPLSVGRVVVATLTRHEPDVQQAIGQLGLDLRLIRNKEALMVLPPGVDKASGLRRALGDLGVGGADAIGVGDAENDEALLDVCGECVAVANAVPGLSARAHRVTAAPSGQGVLELIGLLLDGRGRP